MIMSAHVNNLYGLFMAAHKEKTHKQAWNMLCGQWASKDFFPYTELWGDSFIYLVLIKFSPENL